MARYKGKFEQKSAPRQNYEEISFDPQEQIPANQKKRMPVAARIILVALCVIVVLCAAVLIVANHYLNKINRDVYQGDMTISHTELMDESEILDVEDSTEVIEEVWDQFEELQDMPMIETSDNITNYLLVGCDDRGRSNTGNADAMMIVSLNRDTKKIHIASLMRACFVIYPDGLRYNDGMLNWAYAWGGPEKLVETVEMNFKVDIDHYIAVSFGSFKDVVDAMGGVEITLTGNEAWFVNNHATGSYVSEGTHLLNGSQALAYSRCRGAENNDNDFRRTSRQRDVIEAMIGRVGSLSVSQLTEIADTLLPAISTDMTNADILSEVVNVAEYATYEMDQMLVPIENQDGNTYTGMMYKYGAEMYAIDWETNLPVLEEFITS